MGLRAHSAEHQVLGRNTTSQRQNCRELDSVGELFYKLAPLLYSIIKDFLSPQNGSEDISIYKEWLILSRQPISSLE